MTYNPEYAYRLLTLIKEAVAHPHLQAIKEHAMFELVAMDKDAAEEVAKIKAEAKAKADAEVAKQQAEEAKRIELEVKKRQEEEEFNRRSQVVQKPQLAQPEPLSEPEPEPIVMGEPEPELVERRV